MGGAQPESPQRDQQTQHPYLEDTAGAQKEADSTSSEAISLSPELDSPLNIIVTSGGTTVPIDQVRCLTNYSRGTTGSLIAEHALDLGHSVKFVCSKGSKEPFASALILNPQTNFEEEVSRLRAIADGYRRHSKRLEVVQVKDFDEYHQTLIASLSNPAVQVVILGMAASDYGPDQAEGKISSSQDSLTLELKPLPKIISEVKRTRREIFLVGFKLLIDEDPDVVVEKAYRSMLRDGQDLAVANVGTSLNLDELKTYLVTIEKGITAVNRDELPSELLRIVADRYSNRYYKTQHERVEQLPLAESEMEVFLESIKRLSSLALFNPYLQGNRAEFGFVASRTSAGTLITGRGSSKSDVGIDDIALITDIDQEHRSISVVSTKKKASLNANLAHLILASRPDVNHIVHAHIPLPGASHTERETAPGTEEDWEVVKPLVERGDQILYQPNHGVIILLGSFEELIPILEKNGVYSNNAELYDLAYSRFQKSTRFIDIIDETLLPSSKILDFACGTGEVSKHLLERGFTDLVLADGSESMLNAAQTKLPTFGEQKFRRAMFEDFQGDQEFDGVVIRQAINYVPPEKLASVFQRFHQALRDEGVLIFNSFEFNASAPPQGRAIRDDTDEAIVLTQEGNLIEGNVIHHGQRTEIFYKGSDEHRLVYDLNSFFIIDQQQFLDALEKAGFSSVEVNQEAHSLTFVCSK